MDDNPSDRMLSLGVALAGLGALIVSSALFIWVIYRVVTGT